MQNYEDFSESQLKILKRFVTNTSSNIFALKNLPEVIKGALFSRYSRSSLGLRSLLLKEFVTSSETAFDSIVGDMLPQEEGELEDQTIAIKKAQNFYDRILDGYGDDSIGELGGAHLAIENISMLAAKIIEDSRIGGSPLEKSTRYIYFDQKVNGEYLYYREPVLMTSAFKKLYLETCDHLFETYSKLIPSCTQVMEGQFPQDPETSKVAYAAALRAKVLDCLRGLLPCGTLTNMGVFGNGRFWESLIQKLHCQNLAELQEIGKQTYEELSKVVPSFIRRAELGHKHQRSYAQFFEAMQDELKVVSEHHVLPNQEAEAGVKLLEFDEDAVNKVAAALLYSFGNASLDAIKHHVNNLSSEEVEKILDAGCAQRTNRRQKSPRALEHAVFTFEIVGDFGIYRDLQRHRMLTQERQLLTCEYGYYIPEEIVGSDMEEPYRQALQRAKEAYDLIAQDLPEEAQYVVPMAFNIRWYFHVNLRSLQWLCELRSSAAGHPNYRYIAQEMARQVVDKFPAFERFLKFVDYDGYELGRLDQETRQELRKSSRNEKQ